ncbi:hypothetical protein A200_03649 [Parascardovia denticolens IPLA 20019]|nr:hypothetical protein A200_03649 [Parascardovia denticolens IPLA 20019]
MTQFFDFKNRQTLLIILWTVLLHGEAIEVIGNTKQRTFLPAIRDAVEHKELLGKNSLRLLK